MALGPIVRPPIQPQAPAPARDLDAVRRAFFQAALGQVAAPAAAEPARPAAAAVQAAAQPPAEPEPRRNYRPGSLLDMKV
jgi:hypothetical protein